MSNKFAAIFAVIVGAMGYGLYFSLSKLLLNYGFSSLSMVASTGIATLILAVIYLFFERNKIQQFNDFLKGNPLKIVSAGLLVAGISPFLLYFGQSMTSATNSAFLYQFVPVFSAILGFFLIKEKLGKLFWPCLIVILFGAFLLTTKGNFSVIPSVGDFLILGVAFNFGIYNVLARSFPKGLSAGFLSCMRLIFGCVFAFLILVIFSSLDFSPLLSQPLLIFSNAFLVFLNVLTLHFGIKNIGASNTSAFFSSTALFSAFFAILILGEILLPIQYLGGLLILSGVVFFSLKVV